MRSDVYGRMRVSVCVGVLVIAGIVACWRDSYCMYFIHVISRCTSMLSWDCLPSAACLTIFAGGLFIGSCLLSSISSLPA